MTKPSTTSFQISSEQVGLSALGPLRVVEDIPGFDKMFYTATLTGGSYQLSDPFTTGDIEALTPEIKIVSRSVSLPEHKELPELLEYDVEVARLEAMGMPSQFDFTDILEP